MKVLSSERQVELETRLKKALQKDPLAKSQKDREGLVKNMDAVDLLNNFRNNHYLSFIPALFVNFLIRQYATRALSHAAALGKTDLSAKLIDVYGADVNYRDDHKETPLMRAMLQRRFGTAEMLAQHGGKAIRFKRGQTLLFHFCFENVSSAIPVLKRLNFDLDKPIVEWNWKKNDFGWGFCPYYPIAIAAYAGETEVLKALIENGARLDVPFGNRGSLKDVAAGKTSVRLKPAVIEILNNSFSQHERV